MGRHQQNTDRVTLTFSALVLIFLNFCMSQKAALPSLTGHRTKTRKRDEKQVNDPTGFRDSVIEGLSNTGSDGSDITETEVGVDLDAVFKFLDTAGNKLDYRRYGEVLLEILIAGASSPPEEPPSRMTGETSQLRPELVSSRMHLTWSGLRPGTSRSLFGSCADTNTSRKCLSRR